MCVDLYILNKILSIITNQKRHCIYITIIIFLFSRATEIAVYANLGAHYKYLRDNGSNKKCNKLTK